ncbi:hypothetical protein [Maioricimonas sp. JC845]|uniref:hypothetical protein n=1 Tax=Maioricimonas sp. JC845 TaxID=3232138 RepID=UPI00345750A7
MSQYGGRGRCFGVAGLVLLLSGTVVAGELKYDDGTADGKKSLGGSGEMIRYDFGSDPVAVTGVSIFGSRYGYPQPPDEDFLVYFLSPDERTVLATRMAPYSLFERGDEKWGQAEFEQPVEVSGEVWVVVDFRAHARKGVYVGYDTSGGGGHSRSGLPGLRSKDVDFEGDWMIRVQTGER